MAREAVDKHLQVAGSFIDPKIPPAQKLAAVPKILAYYATWYPPLWLKGLVTWSRYSDWGSLATHLRFVERSARKLARESFHGMAVYQAKMERKQGFLFRCVDVVMELFTMSACLSHARHLRDDGHPDAAQAAELADVFCRQARRRVRQHFRSLWSNEDTRLNRVAASVMTKDIGWLEEGRLDVGLTAESFKTQFITARRDEAPAEQRRAVS
jgi:hypothetical protein